MLKDFNCNREHWLVVNNLHWLLDASINEDSRRNRINNFLESVVAFRHVTLSLLKADASFRGSIKESINKRIEVMAIDNQSCQDFV